MAVDLKCPFAPYPGRGKDDFTLYYHSGYNASASQCDDFYTLLEVLGGGFSADVELRVPESDWCRALACMCNSGEAISVTLRDHGLENKPEDLRKDAPLSLPRAKENNGNPDRLATLIAHTMVNDSTLSGLIVVAGPTGSGKSTLARNLMCELLLHPCSGGEQARHVIALGQPIDCWPLSKCCVAAGPWGGMPHPPDLNDVYRELGVYWTPREVGVDTEVELALRDALRQKPAAVYLDEVRDEAQWRAILAFAETGHFMVTTTHAGSVTEAISKILRAAEVRHKSEAPVIASRLLAVVYQGRDHEPEIWLGRRGAGFLGVYGLGALIPEDSAKAEDSAYFSKAAVKGMPLSQETAGAVNDH